MNDVHRFVAEHRRLTRRFFLGLNAAGAAAITFAASDAASRSHRTQP